MIKPILYKSLLSSRKAQNKPKMPLLTPAAFFNEDNTSKFSSYPLVYRSYFYNGVYLNPKNINFINLHSNSPSKINIDRLRKLGIPNFAIASSNGCRGESLSSKKNRKYLPAVKNSGIDTIIDLRDKYKSTHLPELCSKYNLKYFNIPIDSSTTDDRKIIDSLPELFDIMNNNNYYISCAQGLHRTDIALSLNYVFNPKAKDIPVLIGHFNDGNLKFDDISRRLNSIKKSLKQEDLNKMGWDDTFLSEFRKRKEELAKYNTTLASL